MPANRKKETPEEGRIAKAIKALDAGEQPSVLAAHKAFNVPYHKLLGRYRHGTKASHRGQNKALDPAQEQSLLEYIDRCDQLGRPAKRHHIKLAANSILWASGDFKEVSSAWLTRFIRRNDIKRHRTKPLAAERKAAHEKEDILLHFENFRRRVCELRIPKRNIFNFDETGFRIGCLRGQIVFTRTKKQVYISDPDNRELITSMESICANESVEVDPMIIMSGILMKEKHFRNNLSDNILIGVSDSGYTNDLLSFEWLKHFNQQTEEGANN